VKGTLWLSCIEIANEDSSVTREKNKNQIKSNIHFMINDCLCRLLQHPDSIKL
jgi:hypothetical protein